MKVKSFKEVNKLYPKCVECGTTEKEPSYHWCIQCYNKHYYSPKKNLCKKIKKRWCEIKDKLKKNKCYLELDN